ncbi:MAG: hypothetical protein M1300_01410 [Epsilonproteobacteria bacterium]|nr:hypothetical protein [Campylobacterota bacterium]
MKVVILTGGFWKKAINHTGFRFIEESIDTKIATLKGTKKESLKHFICKAL